MPFTVRNGVQLYYDASGQGTPVLYHTGGGGDGRMWSLAGYTQATSGCRNIVMDHRGHGRSDAPSSLEDHELGEYVADLFAVLDDAGVERSVVIGYSGGARISTAAAAAHPDRFLALACIGYVPSDTDEGGLELAAEVRRIGMRKLMEEYAAVESEVPPAWLIDNLATTTSEMFVLCLEARRSTNNWDCLAQITAPVLLVSGTEESSISDLDAAIERIARCQGMRLDGYGHLQTFWHAEVTAPLIVDFLRSQVPNFSG
jgi:pimeloyl-ACP methyl ester carboxylesterase